MIHVRVKVRYGALGNPGKLYDLVQALPQIVAEGLREENQPAPITGEIAVEAGQSDTYDLMRRDLQIVILAPHVPRIAGTVENRADWIKANITVLDSVPANLDIGVDVFLCEAGSARTRKQ